MKRRHLVFTLGLWPLLPAHAQAAGLHVGFLADTGTGLGDQRAVAQQLIALHQKQPLDLILLGGDIIYTNGEIEKIKTVFEIPYAPLLKAKVPFYAALGNHDIRTKSGAGIMTYFNMPAKYYSFIKGPAQFFALNTNDFDQTQAQWLDQQLAQSTASWKIVFGHHNVFTTFEKYQDSGLALGRKLSPILAKYKVHLYLNGHVHGYERTLPQDGVTYVTGGGGGAHLYEVQSGASFNAFSRRTHEFVSLRITRRRLDLQAVDSQGNTFDQVSFTP